MRIQQRWWAIVLWPFLVAAKGPADYELLQQRTAGGVDFDERPWAEVQHQLPPAPEPKNLVPIYIGPANDNQFAVDEQSVTLSEDGVVRYTLVVTSSSGARNVSYEGIRCATGERRLYAFGRSDGTWSQARSNQWVRIENVSHNRHHSALFGDYFCTTGGLVMSTDAARRVLRNGNPAAPRNAR